MRTAQLTHIILSTLAICFSISRPTNAQQSSTELETFKPFVNPTTMVVVQLDAQRLNLPPGVQTALANNKDAPPLVSWTTSMRSTLAPLLDDQVSIMVDVPFSASQVPVRFVAKKPASLDAAKLNAGLATYRFSPLVVQGDFLSTSPAGNLAESNRLLVGNETLPSNFADLPAAWATVKDMPVRILIVPPAYLIKTYEELMPRLPDSWGGTPTTTITEGIQWAAIGIDPASMKLQVTIQSKSSAAAERLVAELPKLMSVATNSAPLLKFKSAIDTLKFDKPVVRGDCIEVTSSTAGDIGSATGSMMQMLTAIIDPLNVREKQNRFKQLALAIHNYESANKVLPPNQAARRTDGSSYLSWRVHILPYLDEEKLYSEFKLNESWDSEHNKKLLDKMPDIFSSYPVPALAPPNMRGYTTVLAPVGEGTMFGGNKPVPFGMVKDGLSNTIFFVEVKPERALPWTAPMDYKFPLNNPADGLAIGADGQFLCAMGDGSVRLLPGNLPKDALLHLFQMNDGQVIQLP